MIEDAHDHCALEDEHDQMHAAAATRTVQRIDFMDAGNQPRLHSRHAVGIDLGLDPAARSQP
ncbi:MAG TPA: hypothetical protein VMQ83_04375 [Gammaproteobacteria bacterium]|nr:hypothetical protein [Gammaproteobacteria bacterium]